MQIFVINYKENFELFYSKIMQVNNKIACYKPFVAGNLMLCEV